MSLRKSTKVWLAILAVATFSAIVLNGAVRDPGCASAALVGLAVCAGLVLLVRAIAAAFRAIIRRLTLRLAFSYFLIGIVPIPLLATILFLGAYLVAHQYMANRLRREVTQVGESALRSAKPLPVLRVDADGLVASSELPWLHRGDPAPWLRTLARPGFLVSGEDVWLVIRDGSPSEARLLHLSDPAAPWLQQLADLTGYAVGVGPGSTNGNGVRVDPGPRPQKGVRFFAESKPTPVPGETDSRPRGLPPGDGIGGGEWVHAFYLETALNAKGEKADTGKNVAILHATTSPRVLFGQLFAQGVAEVSRTFWLIFAGLAATLLLVYLIALGIAFVLVGSIARNVNRLTRATQAMARGDFSVRVHSKSRDQIGDLARSFDAMAESIQRLLVETARKERLESELAVARTIQHKLLPPPEATLSGLSFLAHFEPVAEIGGDYYDYIAMPNGQTAITLGDVSGHGLPTGLLVAMAKAGLSTLLEAGHEKGDLFGRLNELIHRSTDPRHYMTLALLAYDPRTRRGSLTNAGQLAPYRITGGTLESLSLPSFPLGLFPDRTFPTRDYAFSSGDVLVFFSDGLVEAADASDEPFGFERFEGVLRAHAAAGAAQIRTALLAAVRAHAGSKPLEDDCTLVLVTLD